MSGECPEEIQQLCDQTISTNVGEAIILKIGII